MLWTKQSALELQIIKRIDFCTGCLKMFIFLNFPFVIILMLELFYSVCEKLNALKFKLSAIYSIVLI